MAEHHVELYVYDLSRGLARELAQPLLGTHIDGVWHSSIVAWGREIYFGQGIRIATPGSTHFGAPHTIHSLGMTSVDWDMFEDILNDMRPRFRAEDYHMLEHNCNDFTREAAQILTGADTPAYLATTAQTAALTQSPVGRTLLEQLERGATGGSPLSALLAQMQAEASESRPAQPPAQPQAVPEAPRIIDVTSVAHLIALTEQPCVAILFTSPTCPPCRVAEPAFEELAHSGLPVTFARVVAGTRGTFEAMDAAGVRGTPTVHVHTFGRRTAEVTGADIPEIRMQVHLAAADVRPLHPHVKASLRALSAVPRAPALSSAVPNTAPLLARLETLAGELGSERAAEAYAVLANDLVPWITGTRDAPDAERVAVWDAAVHAYLDAGSDPAQLFPLYDLMRLVVPTVDLPAAHVAVTRAADALMGNRAPALRALWLTALRLVGNMVARGAALDRAAAALVADGAVHTDASVRTAAAAALFNAALALQRERADHVECSAPGEWVVDPAAAARDAQLAEACLAGLRSEDAEACALRLAAALLLVVYRAPSWNTHLHPLLRANTAVLAAARARPAAEPLPRILADLIALVD